MRALRLFAVAITLMAVSACTDAEITAPNGSNPPACGGTTAGSGC